MKSRLKHSSVWKVMTLGLAVVGTSALAKADILITEIMYNPAGSNEHEYVELYNSGNAVVDLTGYKLADAGNNTCVLPSSSIQPGQTAVVVRIDNPSRVLTNYQNAWGAGINWIAPNSGTWPVYSASDTVTLMDPSDNVIGQVAFTVANGFPPDADGPSIYMIDLGAANPYSGVNWAQSVDGVDGAHFGNSPRALDLGSPGTVPTPEPASLVVLSITGLVVVSGRRCVR